MAASAPQHILDLATQLLGDDGGQWTPDKIQAQLATRKTKQANFVKPLPVYIVYFSSAALIDGKIVDYQDLYGRDAKAMAALNMKDGGASLAPPKAKPEEIRSADPVAKTEGENPLEQGRHALTRYFGFSSEVRLTGQE